MSAETQKVDVLSVPSFAGREHARWMVVAGDNPSEKWVHDAAFGHYGVSVAKVSFEHEYSHNPGASATMAEVYADRLVACADAMKGIANPRAFRDAMAELIEGMREIASRHSDKSVDGQIARAALSRVGGSV